MTGPPGCIGIRITGRYFLRGNSAKTQPPDPSRALQHRYHSSADGRSECLPPPLPPFRKARNNRVAIGSDKWYPLPPSRIAGHAPGAISLLTANGLDTMKSVIDDAAARRAHLKPATPTAVNVAMGLAEWLLIIVLSVIWGGSFFFIKVAVSEVTPPDACPR